MPSSLVLSVFLTFYATRLFIYNPLHDKESLFMPIFCSALFHFPFASYTSVSSNVSPSITVVLKLGACFIQLYEHIKNVILPIIVFDRQGLIQGPLWRPYSSHPLKYIPIGSLKLNDRSGTCIFQMFWGLIVKRGENLKAWEPLFYNHVAIYQTQMTSQKNSCPVITSFVISFSLSFAVNFKDISADC